MKAVFVLVLVAIAQARNVPQGTKKLSTGRIVGGEDATIEDFPYQCSLRHQGSHTCGCVILNDTNVMTAGHCVNGDLPEDLEVYYGSSNRTTGGILAAVTAYTLHPDYSGSSIDGFPNDIAIIAVPLVLDGVTAAAAALPSGNDDFSGDMGTIVGWGRTTGFGSLAEVLQKANLPVMFNEECSTELGMFGTIFDFHICVYDIDLESAGSCNGDSGSALICLETGAPVVAGLTSWGINVNGECSQAQPSVYTRVSYFLDWILDGEVTTP